VVRRVMHELCGTIRTVADSFAGLFQDVQQAAGVVAVESAAGEEQSVLEFRPRSPGWLRTEFGQHIVHVSPKVLVGHVAAAVADQ